MTSLIAGALPILQQRGHHGHVYLASGGWLLFFWAAVLFLVVIFAARMK